MTQRARERERKSERERERERERARDRERVEMAEAALFFFQYCLLKDSASLLRHTFYINMLEYLYVLPFV